MKGGNNNNNNGGGKGKFNRNKSFGDSGSNKNGGATSATAADDDGFTPIGGNKGQRQPARRCASHDPQKLKQQMMQNGNDDDDGFITPMVKKNSRSTATGNVPRGRMNPTSSFTRPRNTQSFNKPRPTGSFKKGRDNNNNNNNNGGPLPSMNGVRSRNNSFSKPRPTGSFNNKFAGKNNNNETNSPNDAAAAKREMFKRSSSRLTSTDVELYSQGDGKTPAQRNVVRIHQDVMLRARLSNMDPPSFGDTTKGGDSWNPHHKCLWNDESRRDQIEQIMQQYPNSIPLHLKKRTRIRSSKLGDAASTDGTRSVVTNDDDDRSEAGMNDDSSLGTSMRSTSERFRNYNINRAGSNISTDGMTIATGDDIEVDDNNPLRKTLLLLNKLSWTTIDKLTPRLFSILEDDVPKVMTSSSNTSMMMPPSTIVVEEGKEEEASPPPPAPNTNEVSPMVMTILTMIVEKSQTEPHFSAMYAQLCKRLAERNKAWKKKILAHCQSEFENDTAWHIARLDERLDAKSALGGANGTMEDGSTNTIATEDMDREYQVLQLRKKYKGHVQFLGELFKLGLIKLDILIWCLSRLLFHKDVADEDDLECFAKLMTVVGEQASGLVHKGKCHAMAEEKWYQCWDHVYLLTGRTKKGPPRKKKEDDTTNNDTNNDSNSEEPAKVAPKVSSRIKFMLVDLLELEENAWVQRRTDEKPKTIAEIHEEVRNEEAAAIRRSYSDDWGSMGGSGMGGSGYGNRRRVNSDDMNGSGMGGSGKSHSRRRGNNNDDKMGGSGYSNRRRVSSDDYGGGGSGYSQSPSYRAKPEKKVDADGFTAIPTKQRTSFVRRAVSDVEVLEIYNKPTKKKKQPMPVPTSPTGRSKTVISQIDITDATPQIVEYPDPQECKDKTKTILKEYFIAGDTKDAILSIDELVGAGRDNEDHGSVERGAAFIEAGVLLVLEMKQQDVQKFLALAKRCLQQKKIEKASLPLGLKDPLEFLSDIEIDAPLARSLLTSIVAYWVRQEVLKFDFLLDAPEYFRKDGKPAEFAAAVLKMRGGDVSDEDLSVVEKLMTEGDKKKFSSAKEMIAPET